MHQTLRRTAGIGLEWVAWVIPVAAAAAMGLGVFARLMNFGLRRDEQLYVPPERLLDQHALYQDFFYNQVPGSAWYFHAVRLLLGTDSLLMSGRIAVLLAWIGLVAGIAVITYMLTQNRLVAVCAVVLTCMNELLLNQTGMAATNNLLPLPLAYLGIGLFLLGACFDEASPGGVFAAGLCLSVACLFKISAVAFIPPVAIAAFFLPRTLGFRERLEQVVLPLVAGGLIGGLPILFYLAVEPGLFLAHVVGYHTGAHIGYWDAHEADDGGVALTLFAKLQLAWRVWLAGALPVAIAAVLALVAMRYRTATLLRPSRTSVLPAACVVCASALSGIVVSFVPTPGFPQYYALPLICLPLALALAFRVLTPFERSHGIAVLVAACLVIAAASVPRLAEFVPKLAHPAQWTVVQVHRDGLAIAKALAARGVAGKVATLAPIYPLEAGLSVYPELATGPFAYRADRFVDPKLAKYYRSTSPEKIGALFDKEPPAAMLLGFDPDLERPMLAYARAHAYALVPDVAFKDRYGTARLYVKPQNPS